MKLTRIMKAQSSKKNEKERNNNNNNNNKKKKRICGKDLDQTRGHAARISVRPEDMQQEESTTRPYVCSDF